MTLKEIFVADLKATLEETSNIMADRIILESLAKHGSITLDEAEFYDGLVRRVITEAAEDFVPESLTIPALEEMGMDYEGKAQEGEAGPGLPIDGEGEDMILTGEDGTVYSFNTATKELVPVEGAEGAEEAEETLEDLESNEADHEDSDEPEAFGESTEAEGEVVEESTEVKTELTESQMIVSNLIKSLGN